MKEYLVSIQTKDTYPDYLIRDKLIKCKHKECIHIVIKAVVKDLVMYTIKEVKE